MKFADIDSQTRPLDETSQTLQSSQNWTPCVQGKSLQPCHRLSNIDRREAWQIHFVQSETEGPLQTCQIFFHAPVMDLVDVVASRRV